VQTLCVTILMFLSRGGIITLETKFEESLKLCTKLLPNCVPILLYPKLRKDLSGSVQFVSRPKIGLVSDASIPKGTVPRSVHIRFFV